MALKPSIRISYSNDWFKFYFSKLAVTSPGVQDLQNCMASVAACLFRFHQSCSVSYIVIASSSGSGIDRWWQTVTLSASCSFAGRFLKSYSTCAKASRIQHHTASQDCKPTAQNKGNQVAPARQPEQYTNHHHQVVWSKQQQQQQALSDSDFRRSVEKAHPRLGGTINTFKNV